MATLSIRPASKRDWIRLRQVRQRRVSLAPPWGDHSRTGNPRSNLSALFAGFSTANDVLVAEVDDELCALAVFEREPQTFRWNICTLAAGSPRVDATDEVADELWVALVEEGIKWAGRSGARRVFAFSQADTTEYLSLVTAGFSAYSRYSVLRGTFKRGLRESVPVREQHDSDLWSIHQLYNRTTPRPVQYAEALTSDAWATESESRIPFRNRRRLGVVVPTEDGIGAACHIDLAGSRPSVTVLCDERLAHAIPSIVADSLELASTDEEIDVVLPGYQQHWTSLFLNAGFSVVNDVVGMVRHTTASVPKEAVPAEVLSLSDARPAVSVTYPGISFLDRGARVRDGA